MNSTRTKKEKTMNKRFRLLTMALMAVLLAVIAPRWAEAVGTPSNTTILNRATIDYKVNTVAQAQMGSAPGAGNSTPGGAGADTTFKVDNKVDVTIANNNANTVVTTYPGSPMAGNALKFTVSNLGNTTQDYVLTTIADPSNTVAGESVALYNDDGGTPGSWDGTDTVNAGARLTSIAAGGTAVVYIVITPLNSALNGQKANYALKAVTYKAAGGLIEAQTNVGVADDPTLVDVVFGDGDGDGTGADDATLNGFYVKWENAGAGGNGPCGIGAGCDAFLVSAAQLTVAKTSAVISDPILGVSANAKAIPGATVEYTITITNAAGSATATNITIADNLDANVTYVPASMTANINGGGAVALTDAVDVEGPPTGDFTASTVNVGSVTLAATQNAVIKYQVTIN